MGTEQLNFAFEQLRDDLKQVANDLKYLSCQISNDFQFVYRSLVRSAPSEVLSRLLRSKVGAVSSGNLMAQLSCSQREIYLRASLELDNESVATMPLAYALVNNNTHLVQWSSDGFWSEEILYFQAHPLRGARSFEVDGRVIRYQGSRLEPDTVSAALLSHSFNYVPLVFPSFDFTATTERLGKTMITTLMMAELIKWMQTTIEKISVRRDKMIAAVEVAPGMKYTSYSH